MSNDHRLWLKFRSSPIWVTLTIVTLLSGSLTAFANLSGKWDEWHTTDDELQKVVRDQAAAVAAAKEVQKLAKEEREIIRRESRCQALDIQISIIEDQIWQMEQSGQTTQRLVEKRRELENKLEKRRELSCSSFD